MITTIQGRLLDGSAVSIDIMGSMIQSIRALNEADNVDSSALPYIAPGLVDIQVNGYGGFDLQRPGLTPTDVAKLIQRLWVEGVTSFCPTITSHSHEHMIQSVMAIARVYAEFPQEALSIAGIHLEGPFISPEDGPRGAHPLQHTRQPDFHEYRQLQDAAQGKVRIVTLAPELPEATALIAGIASDGVVVAIGHTNANEADIQAAIKAGARLSTHLGNGSHQMLHRHKNYIWEQLAQDRLIASLITDGHHLPASVVTCMLRAKGMTRVVLISDSAFPGGLAPGLYENTYGGGLLELRPDGYLGAPGTPNLAGSASSLRQCLAGAAKMTHLSLSELLPLATEQPAALIGRADIGRLTPGARADLILFHLDQHELEIEQTLLAGKVVYRRQAGSINGIAL